MSHLQTQTNKTAVANLRLEASLRHCRLSPLFPRDATRFHHHCNEVNDIPPIDATAGTQALRHFPHIRSILIPSWKEPVTSSTSTTHQLPAHASNFPSDIRKPLHCFSACQRSLHQHCHVCSGNQDILTSNSTTSIHPLC